MAAISFYVAKRNKRFSEQPDLLMRGTKQTGTPKFKKEMVSLYDILQRK